MSLITELARKEAGISDLSKNYPKDSHQRGCAYWQRFVTSVSVLTDQQAELIQKLERELRITEKRVAELTHRLNKESVESVILQHPELPDHTTDQFRKAVKSG